VTDLILAVDTTHEFGSLALLHGPEVLEEVLLHSPEGFGQILFGRLGELLARHGSKPAEVDCFAVKGLAEATGKPAVAVSNLAAMARFGSAALRAVVLDARRGEVYGAVYNAGGRAVAAETVMPFTAWLRTLPEGEIEFVATDFAPFAAALEGTRFTGAAVTTAPRALAAAVGRIGYERWRAGEGADPAGVDANYVRRSDAELFWKEY
jgi:tRNA threonylcarbamoyladenosine biosynthesis protein TsaB